MKHIFLSTFTIISLFLRLPALAQISGHVGPINNLNKGLAQLTVRAFDAQNQRLAATKTDANGHYRLELPAGQHVRIEVADLPPGYGPAPGQARVQFVTSPAEVNCHLWQPGQYVGAQPQAGPTTAMRAILSTGPTTACCGLAWKRGNSSGRAATM